MGGGGGWAPKAAPAATRMMAMVPTPQFTRVAPTSAFNSGPVRAHLYNPVVSGKRFSKMEDIVEVPWGAAAPDWRRATKGLNLEGK